MLMAERFRPAAPLALVTLALFLPRLFTRTTRGSSCMINEKEMMDIPKRVDLD